jgi:mono/diheme cytochrome c family protein
MTDLTKSFAIAILCLALPLSAWADGQAGLFAYRDAQTIAAGERIYADYCASCHGAQLEGQENWRDRDADGYLPAPPHDVTGHTWHHPDRQLFEITKYGIEAMIGGGYKSRMIGFGDILSDDEILSVLAYIKSTWPAPVVARHNQLNEMSSN